MVVNHSSPYVIGEHLIFIPLAEFGELDEQRLAVDVIIVASPFPHVEGRSDSCENLLFIAVVAASHFG